MFDHSNETQTEALKAAENGTAWRWQVQTTILYQETWVIQTNKQTNR